MLVVVVLMPLSLAIDNDEFDSGLAYVALN